MNVQSSSTAGQRAWVGAAAVALALAAFAGPQVGAMAGAAPAPAGISTVGERSLLGLRLAADVGTRLRALGVGTGAWAVSTGRF